MIGNALRIDIEQWAGKSEHNVLFSTTRAGKLTKEMMARYLNALHFMLTLTPVHLVKARDKAYALGDEQLAAHFQHKLGDEVGHDAWADDDLRSLNAQRAAKTEVMASARSLALSLESAIDAQPARYLAYIAFVEYMTVLVGPRWLTDLEERCGIPRSSMTAVANHVELDREHAEEGFSVIDDLVVDPKLLPSMREALAEAIALYESICAEAVYGAQREAVDFVVEEHVSAA